MKIQRRNKDTPEVSTEALNDIMFFLLLFFLIISTLSNPNVIKLTLPNSNTSDVMPLQQVIVEISADHQYVVNQIEIPFTDLENAIRIELDRTNSPTVVLRLDNTLTIQDLADVMQIGYNLGIKMVLSTKSTSTK
jgi:biopolymer transport protein ExbD